ncbi:hypothetical protein ZWY2020_014853 [Hordeum vulgare]|uniref:C3H1-type domain-containing protein n=2 Tax=Hordeum vulgare subsp. vulgare TaxID=112509 RepID=A0A8I6Y3Q4_HORVV|nr:hypothetical protein ZWY2020_014853 [Hordeum vulgare]
MSSTPDPDAPPREVERRITYSRESLLSVREARRHKLPAAIGACKREVEAASHMWWESEPRGGSKSEPPRTSKSKKMCTRFFSAGDCPFGEDCRYLHRVPNGHHEPNQTVTKKMSSLDLGGDEAQPRTPVSATAPATVKTRLCKNHGAPDGCKWGDRCHFAHGDGELGKPMGPGSSFKTRLCVSFVAGGSCAFAGRCHFAHGKEELRRPDAS